MKTNWILLCALLVLVGTTVTASGKRNKKLLDKIITPDYINLQYAGNLGLGSVGFGYISENQKHNFGASYGYLPSTINSVEVHTISAKGAFNFRRHKFSKNAYVNGYAGTNLLFSITDNTYLKFPGYYPSDYYFANAVHLAPFLGLKIGSRKNISKFSYVELGTVDYYLINHIKYRRSEFSDCLNVCMGITVPLNKGSE
jgi:hypothetical protein